MRILAAVQSFTQRDKSRRNNVCRMVVPKFNPARIVAAQFIAHSDNCEVFNSAQFIAHSGSCAMVNSAR
ncbi:hypothetical protein N172_12860 [Pantoea dispersa EGD-AAK13]|nr:hypothetical protein N172_12860 [Pantoea dispersa EGD-AAK13]